MSTWVAFLRAVNIGKRKYPMAQLREALTVAGFEDVETHIQTGNVRFATRMRSRERIVAALEKAMLADRGFEVRVVLLTPAELVQVLEEAQRVRGEAKPEGHYVTLLAAPVDPTLASVVEALSTDGEEVRVGERAVHLMLHKRFHEARNSNATVERHLGVATTRNLTVIRALADKWGR